MVVIAGRPDPIVISLLQVLSRFSMDLNVIQTLADQMAEFKDINYLCF